MTYFFSHLFGRARSNDHGLVDSYIRMKRLAAHSGPKDLEEGELLADDEPVGTNCAEAHALRLEAGSGGHVLRTRSTVRVRRRQSTAWNNGGDRVHIQYFVDYIESPSSRIA